MKASKGSERKTVKVTAAKPSDLPSKKATTAKKVDEKKSPAVTTKAVTKKSSVIESSKTKPKEKDGDGSFSLALDKIRKKVGERRRSEEIERIRSELAEGENGNEAGNGQPAVGSWGMPPGNGTMANLPLNYRMYYQAIEQKIKNNWNLALPRGVIEDMQGMEVVIGITIRSDGEITDISFEKKTGNVYLDDSAYRSVKKSSPLPPFSEFNIREPFFETGIVFPAGELL